MLRSLHIGVSVAYAGQTIASLLAVAAAWHVWRNATLPQQSRLLLTALLVPFATPYGFTDDLCLISVLMLTLARRDTPWRNAALAWLWSIPVFIPYITAHAHILITPLLLACALILAWQSRYELGAKMSGQTANATAIPAIGHAQKYS
jgi:hypothetical protein